MDSKDENKVYPPPDIKDQTSTFAHPGISQPYPPYLPNEATQGLSPPPYSSHPASEPTQVPSSSIPQIYPPYPPTKAPAVTSPPNTGQSYSYQSASGATTIQVVEAPPNFGSESQYVRCPNCGTQGFTKIDHKPTTTTHMMALILCCVILWPIAWLPYVCTSCQSTVHYCSHCNHYLGERNM